MKKLKQMVGCLLAIMLVLAGLSGCGKKTANVQGDTSVSKEKKLKVVATIFPEYDFLRQIAGNRIELTMLLKPGAESHSFEPAPKDIKQVGEADLFVYVGGESDEWVNSILDSVDTKNMKIVTLMDCVDLVEEQIVEGMTPEEENAEEGTKEDEEGRKEEETEGEGAEEEVEYDEHVWTSPKNAKLIVQKLCDNLCSLDSENEKFYQQNTAEYLKKLDTLDQKFKDLVEHAKRTEFIVGDRFPFRYFADAYGLTYFAAFPGCATETEPSAETIAFLTDKVKEDQIPVVFHIELSNSKVCDSICEATGAKSELLNAAHNITKTDFEAGVTYLDLMEHNVQVLQEALN